MLSIFSRLCLLAFAITFATLLEALFRTEHVCKLGLDLSCNAHCGIDYSVTL